MHSVRQNQRLVLWDGRETAPEHSRETSPEPGTQHRGKEMLQFSRQHFLFVDYLAALALAAGAPVC